MGMLGCALVYVGFVLLINGLWLLGILDDKHVIPMNVFTGFLIFAGSAHLGEVLFRMEYLLG